MPIAYRSKQHPGMARPAWLDHDGARHQDRDDGHLVGLLPAWQAWPAPDADWRDCGDGWECALACAPAELDPRLLRRKRRDLPIVEAEDRLGRIWLTPCVLQPYPLDALAIDVPLGANWQPSPEPWQQTLIGVARWARGELQAGMRDWQDKQLFSHLEVALDEERAAAGCAELLAAANYIAPAVLQALRLVDHQLIGEALKAAAGMSQQVLRRLAEAVDDGGE